MGTSLLYPRSVSLLFENYQQLLLGLHYPTSFVSKLCFPGLLEGTEPTPCPDSAQKRRCCWQDSWENTLAQTPLLFRHFVTQLGHVLRSQVPPRCLKAPGQRSLAPSLCTQVSLGPLRFSLGTSAACVCWLQLWQCSSLPGQRAQTHVKLKRFTPSCHVFGDGVPYEKDSQRSLTGIFLLENFSVQENTGH